MQVIHIGSRFNVTGKIRILQTKTFKKGIKPPHNKHYTESGALVECPTPDVVYIPLSQHIGKPAVPTVAVGDTVKAGTLIGAADGYVSADIFSSVSGTVKAITRRKTPTGFCEHVVIENDGRYECEYLEPIGALTRDAILKRIKDAGLVGMGGAGFPSHVKYAPKTPVDTFIINAAECEPYITCDYRLILEHTEKVLRGAKMLADVLGLGDFYIGIEDNKPKAIEQLIAVSKQANINAHTVVLESKYPQGAEKQLIYAVTGRKVPLGKLPADVGAVVGNVHTAYALYEAAIDNIPLYRRAMTVTGDVEKPANLWVRTGTPYSACAEFCGGTRSDCVKTISGGPMMGFALADTEYSVTKTSGALLFLSDSAANTDAPEPCINCGKCAKVCPMNLMPMYIDAYTLRGDYASAQKYGAMNCIECGCCSYTCPAKRPIVQSVKLCKKMLKEMKK